MLGVEKRIILANLLPPAFICTVVGSIWSIYAFLHCKPMLRLGLVTTEVELARYTRGLWHSGISQVLAFMFTVCYLRCIFVNPGAVPSDPEWLLGSKFEESSTTCETKGSTGDRRFCKWCQKYKPDRCHHCRICKSCVLRMDHHCPWIMNCVGFRNHKYFFLLVVYAVLNCLFIAFTLAESVQRSIDEETATSTRFMLVFGFVLACIMATLMAAFLSFHTYLMAKGMSTIEFCEKNLSGAGPLTASRHVSYDRGLYMNIKAVLGPHWWLWLLPLSPPEGSGLNFSVSKGKHMMKTKGQPEVTGQLDSTP